MDAFITALLVIVPAEMADKTQLVALFLASRFRKPVPVIFGMLAAFLISHLAAGLVGQLIGQALPYRLLHLLLGVSFFCVAIWAFTPDEMDDNFIASHSNHGIFMVAFIAFIMAELGDKTQIATMVLAARSQALLPVVLGSTLGMVAVNIPVVLLSEAISDRRMLNWIRTISGVLFALLGFFEVAKAFQGTLW